MLSIYVGIESTGMMIHTSLHINAIPTKFHPFEPPFNFMYKRKQKPRHLAFLIFFTDASNNLLTYGDNFLSIDFCSVNQV